MYVSAFPLVTAYGPCGRWTWNGAEARKPRDEPGWASRAIRSNTYAAQ